MRKRSIISLLLAFCLCFSMITPAMAAEVNAEAQIEAQAMSRLADLDFVQSADVNEATFSIDGESVIVQNLSKTATLDEISKAELADAIESVANIRETEMDEETDLINYFYLTEDKIYFYEEAANNIDNLESKLIVFDVNEVENKTLTEQSDIAKETVYDTETMDSNSAARAANDLYWTGTSTPLDKTDGRSGVAARLDINNSGITEMTANVLLPTLNQLSGVDNLKVKNYIYLGFHGTNVESDIGFMSACKDNTNTLVGFKPYWLLRNKGSEISSQPFTYDGIQHIQGISAIRYYYPGETMTLALYKNEGGYVQGSVHGRACFGVNYEYSGNVKTVMTSKTQISSNLAPIKNWKAVNTLTPQVGYQTVPNGTKSQCTFSNLYINFSRYAKVSECTGIIYNKGNTKNGYIDYTANGTTLQPVKFVLTPQF